MNIVDKIRAAYLRCGSFSCKGELSRRIFQSPSPSKQIHVRILFARPDALRIEWFELSLARRPKAHLIVAKNRTAYRFDPEEGRWQKEDSVHLALAADAGISAGISSFIPSLLLGSHDFPELGKVARTDDVTFCGKPALKLTMIMPRENKTTMIVSEREHSILKVIENFSISTSAVESVTTYSQIRWNPAIRNRNCVFDMSPVR